MRAFEFIEDHQRVTAVFGCWPSFHDAEIVRVALDRASAGPPHPSLDLWLHGWLMTSEVTAAGHYRLEHPSLIHFQFHGVADVALEGFNHQNVIGRLELALAAGNLPPLTVTLEPCYGLSGRFSALRARIVSVVPYSGVR